MYRSLFISLLCLIPSLVLSKMNYDDIKKAYLNSYRYEKMQNYKDAIKAINIVVYNYPKAYTVNLRLGFLYLKNNHFANANLHYQRASVALPAAISPKLGLLSVALAQGKYSAAQQIAFQIVKKDPFNYFGNLKLIYTYTQLHKYAPAQLLAQKMLTLYPEDRSFLLQLAYLYEIQKQIKEARRLYENILILDPENFFAKKFFMLEKSRKVK